MSDTPSACISQSPPVTPVNIALTKGRIMEALLPGMNSAGISLPEDILQTRKLMVESLCGRYRIFILRGIDATTYVQSGVADVGVVGKDMLLESGAEGVYDILDLQIARCRLMTARPKGQTVNRKPLRVAAKHTRLARRFYAERGIQTRIIKLYGSLELAPSAGLADEIVDLVDTGQSLKSNNLEACELILESSARLIVNKAAMRIRHRAVKDFCERLQQHCVPSA